MELLREALPGGSRLGVLWNPANPAAANDYKEADAGARALGLTPVSLEARKGSDIDAAFEIARKQRADAIAVIQDGLMQNHVTKIADLAKRHRLPAVYASREYVEGGGLMSYGVSYPDLYRRAGIYVAKILAGARPGDLPIEQPTKLDRKSTRLNSSH